jgi:hypothetical protein
MGMWVAYPPMSMPLFRPGLGAPQGSVFDRLKLPVHDRLGPTQSGPAKRISQYTDQSDLHGGSVRPVEQDVEQEFVVQNSFMKGKEKVEQSIIGGEDAQSNVAKEVIKIGNNDVVMGDCFKGLIIINGFTQAQVGNNSGFSQPQENDHEASSSKLDPKYHQPRWCPGGLTHTQKRKLQRMLS